MGWIEWGDSWTLAIIYVNPLKIRRWGKTERRRFVHILESLTSRAGRTTGSSMCSSFAEGAETNTWTSVRQGMLSGWINPSISLNGHLYSSDCRDGCKLRIYDGATDSWSKSIDSKLHLGNSRALEAAALVSLNGKLCVVRNNMSLSLVDVSGSDRHVEASPFLWENIAGKGPLREFMVDHSWSERMEEPHCALSGSSSLKKPNGSILFKVCPPIL